METQALLAPDATPPPGQSRARVLDLLRAAGSPLGVHEVADRARLHPEYRPVPPGRAGRQPKRSAPGSVRCSPAPTADRPLPPGTSRPQDSRDPVQANISRPIGQWLTSPCDSRRKTGRPIYAQVTSERTATFRDHWRRDADGGGQQARTCRHAGRSCRGSQHACQLAVHHLGLGRELDLEPPASGALRLARLTVGIAGCALPDSWADDAAVLLGTGRLRPDPERHGRPFEAGLKNLSQFTSRSGAGTAGRGRPAR